MDRFEMAEHIDRLLAKWKQSDRRFNVFMAAIWLPFLAAIIIKAFIK